MSVIIADFVVNGIAEPKGSVSAFVRGKRAVIVHGGRRNKRKDGTFSDAPERYRRWMRDVAAAAKVWQTVHRRKINDDEPLRVEIAFFLPRPARAAKRVVFPVRRPDSDKLARAVLDALTKGGLIADDARIVDLIVSKRFATETPHARIVVTSLLENAA